MTTTLLIIGALSCLWLSALLANEARMRRRAQHDAMMWKNIAMLERENAEILARRLAKEEADNIERRSFCA